MSKKERNPPPPPQDRRPSAPPGPPGLLPPGLPDTIEIDRDGVMTRTPAEVKARVPDNAVARIAELCEKLAAEKLAAEKLAHEKTRDELRGLRVRFDATDRMADTMIKIRDRVDAECKAICSVRMRDLHISNGVRIILDEYQRGV